MEFLTKILGSAGALALFLVGLYAATKLAWVRLMREYQADEERRLQQSDRELALFRLEKVELTARIRLLTRKSAELENRMRDMGSELYGNQRYIGRLERQLRRLGQTLPSRDGEEQE